MAAFLVHITVLASETLIWNEIMAEKLIAYSFNCNDKMGTRVACWVLASCRFDNTGTIWTKFIHPADGGSTFLGNVGRIRNYSTWCMIPKTPSCKQHMSEMWKLSLGLHSIFESHPSTLCQYLHIPLTSVPAIHDGKIMEWISYICVFLLGSTVGNKK